MLWLSSLENSFSNSPLYNINLKAHEHLRIMEEDFIALFNTIIEGESFSIVNLEKTSDSESYDINKYRNSENYSKNQLFTNLNKDEQLEALKEFYAKSSNSLEHSSVSNSYLCFGLLRYKLNPLSSESCEAPLVLIPVNLSYDEETNTYSALNLKS